MQMLVLKRRSTAGESILCGLYTTMKKAKTAATGQMMQLDWITPKAGKWSVEDRGRAVIYTRTDGETFVIDYWEVDKALINGNWKIL